MKVIDYNSINNQGYIQQITNLNKNQQCNN